MGRKIFWAGLCLKKINYWPYNAQILNYFIKYFIIFHIFSSLSTRKIENFPYDAQNFQKLFYLCLKNEKIPHAQNIYFAQTFCPLLYCNKNRFSVYPFTAQFFYYIFNIMHFNQINHGFKIFSLFPIGR